MADDRQPPQAYDTVAPAGVGAASSNQMSPRAWQDLYLSGDQGLLDVAMEETAADALYQFMESLPAGDVIAGWPDVDGTPPLQTSSPAGVGSSRSYRSIQTTPPSSPDTPLTWGSARLSSGALTPLSQGSARLLTAAGARGGGGGGGRGGRGGRGGGGRGGGGGGAGGRGGGGGGGGGGAGSGGGGGRRGGGGGRRGRRRRLTPPSPLTPASNPASLRGSWSGSPPPRTLRQADLQRRLRMLLQDQEQLAQGRGIANVTMTNSIVTGRSPQRTNLFVPGFAVMKTVVLLLNGSRRPGVPLPPELLQRVDSLYAFYHQQWWCYRKM